MWQTGSSPKAALPFEGSHFHWVPGLTSFSGVSRGMFLAPIIVAFPSVFNYLSCHRLLWSVSDT